MKLVEEGSIEVVNVENTCRQCEDGQRNIQLYKQRFWFVTVEGKMTIITFMRRT